MVPRQMRETWSPVRPRRTCCTAWSFPSERRWLGRSGTRAGTSPARGPTRTARGARRSRPRAASMLSSGTPIMRSWASSTSASCGTSGTSSCAVRRTFVKPADSRIPCVRSGSPSAKGPVGLLPGSGVGGRRHQPARARRRGTTGSRSIGCQHANAIRPPGARCEWMLANAVSGSSKNITPNWLITTSNGAPAIGVLLHVGNAERHVAHAGLGRPLARRARSARPEMSAPVAVAAGRDRLARPRSSSCRRRSRRRARVRPVATRARRAGTA